MESVSELSVIKGKESVLIPNRLNRIFEDNLTQQKNESKPALIYHDQHDNGHERERITSYKQLNSQSNKIASLLLKLINNSEPSPNTDGDWIIAVSMAPTDNLVKTLLSIWKSGAAYLPIDPSFPRNRIEHILNESKPVLVIYDECDDFTVFGNTTSISFDQLIEQSINYFDGNIPISNTLSGGSNDLAIVLYTSGSTGVPKGVRLPHAVILNRLQWQWKTFPYSVTEKIGVFKTTLTFVDSVSELWGPLLKNMAILILPKSVTKDPEQLVTILEHYQIERLLLVPTLLRTILLYLPLQSIANLLHNLKIWVCSGEALSSTLAQEFFDYFIEGQHILCNFYGSTEVMGDVTYFICESKLQLQLYPKVPIGYPTSNTVIYVLDSDFQPVKIGDTGELFVAGLNLANGYVNGRDEYRFIENPLEVDSNYNRLYRTGDYASVLKGNMIQYEGRTDSQIKIRGHRVDLSEIEKYLFAIEDVDKGIVLCYHAGEFDQALLAFVTVIDGSKLQYSMQIENILKSKLSDYMVPQVVIVEKIPLLVNGKIDRQGLLQLYESANNNDDSEIFVDYDYSGICDEQKNIAKDLFETIGQAIGRSTRTTLSANCNFYELGGNSLNSIYTVSQLRNKGYFIGIGDFITAKNLQDVLDKICLVGTSAVSENQQETLNENSQFKTAPVTQNNKIEAIEILSSSFYEKSDLEQYLKPGLLYTDHSDILNPIWDDVVKANFSFVVTNLNNEIIAVALNFDARDKPKIPVTSSKLGIIFEFLESIEKPIRDSELLPKGKGKLLHSYMMGTIQELTAQENIAVTHFMEEEILKIAVRQKFVGILTTNTSPLTQQLCSSVYGYKALLDYQVNEYVYRDGTKPFGKAPDSDRIIVHWKDITTQSFMQNEITSLVDKLEV